ncbi:glycosyltransferase family protein [Populus alba x Populus x berolinensis]|uniref:Glycosyltransferase family protein n=1 Tax=Populus alba x Populus x berolinensis TaxID=444605 RepID=A0AAD6W945_9ROSI|nr:glycosyltransferase family protein [Populus alba x Populus x berolinensis]
MSPTVDLRAKPDFTWATRIAQQWKQFIIHPTFLVDTKKLLLSSEKKSNQSIHLKFASMKRLISSRGSQMILKTIKLKRELYDEVLDFQSMSIGTETLSELMAMSSKWDLRGPSKAKVTVILNHFKRKTLCAQLDSLLHQTLPFHHVWVLSFGSPNELSLKRIVDSYNDSRISFRRKMLQILSHVAGTEKYKNSVLGSIGRILPLRQKDFTFLATESSGPKRQGSICLIPAYDITVNKIVQVDFLSSSWFLSAVLVKTLFVEAPMTFKTGEDLHLSYQLQKYRNAGSFVLPVDPNDKETWGDSEHRLAYVSETTWAAMHPQKIDALFYAHSVDEVKALAPLLEKFRSTAGKKGIHCYLWRQFLPL